MRRTNSNSAPRASRLGAVLAVLFVMVLDATLAGRYRLAPQWLTASGGAVLVASLLISYYSPSPSGAHLGRISTVALIVLAMILNAANLVDVVDDVLFHPSGISPRPLIFTALSIWGANTMAFSLLYWALDRGGPDARAANTSAYPDFDFPGYAVSERVTPGWQPSFIDYLFIGFTTSTAFSPTEAMPLTRRAKSLMIVQGLVSLITIIVVAARAIGIVSG